MPCGALLPQFAKIHVAVGGRENIRFAHIWLQHCNPEAGRERNLASVVDRRSSAQQVRQPFYLRPGASLARLIENQSEFVAANARRDINRTNRTEKPVRNFEQREVACGMAKAVVDEFQLIDVGENDCRGLCTALEAGDALMDRGQKVAAVEQRGQRVAFGHAFELGDSDFQDTVLAAKRITFTAQLAKLVLDGV